MNNHLFYRLFHWNSSFKYLNNMSALTKTDFHFAGQKSVYHGKVRDVYNLGERLVMVATDRISAFDVVLPEIGRAHV